MLSLSRVVTITSRWGAQCRHYIGATKASHNAASFENDEYDEVAKYPKIVDNTFIARKKQKAFSFHKDVQNAPTVEEKMIKINMPRYYGYKVVDLHDERLPYNCLPAIQHYTRTLFENMDGELVKDEKMSLNVEAIKGDVQDALELAHDYFSGKYPNSSEIHPKERERILSQVVVEQINRAIINALSDNYQHLQELEVDFNPRHEAFWSVGGIIPPKNDVRARKGIKWLKEFANEPVDRFMQYKSVPMLTLRHSLQLPTWKSEKEYKDFEKVKQIPRVEYDPRAVGFSTSYKHGTNIPGHWPSKFTSFGCLSYESRAGCHVRPQMLNALDHSEALHAHAIQSSFAWLLAQANYYGFNTFSELTYPLNTQTILTDGKTWSFYEYQLNTLLMSGSQIDENPCLNYCRGTKEMTLYQEIDENGKVVGFNDQLLPYLIKFYTNVPNVHRSHNELQPFLDTNIKRVSDYEDEEKRQFLEKAFKHLVSNRPRHLELPEIYLWERIYKIDNDTRPLEARRRYFEVFQNPWKRTLDQHAKEYVPRKLRPECHRSKNRFKKTHYP